MLAWSDDRFRTQESKKAIKTGCSHMPSESFGTPHNKHLKNAPFKFIMPLLAFKGEKIFFNGKIVVSHLNKLYGKSCRAK